MPWSVLKWYLTQTPSPVGVHPLEGVRSEAVHPAQAGRAATVTEEPGELVGQFRRETEEVPDVVRLLNLGPRIRLLGVDEVGELQRVADEEDRGVVADEVVVAVLGVELHRETPWVTGGVGRALRTGDRGEADEDLGLLADLGEEFAWVYSRDVLGHLEGAAGADADRVHHPLRDPLAVEVRELFQQVVVLQQHRPAGARGLRVLVVGYRRTGGGGQTVHCLGLPWALLRVFGWRTARSRPAASGTAHRMEFPL